MLIYVRSLKTTFKTYKNDNLRIVYYFWSNINCLIVLALHEIWRQNLKTLPFFLFPLWRMINSDLKKSISCYILVLLFQFFFYQCFNTQYSKIFLMLLQERKDSDTCSSIKHNAVRSKQHSFIAQLSARVQEVYYFASLLSLCTGVSYKLTEQLMWKTMNTYTVIINTKPDRKSKKHKHGAVKKKILFCTDSKVIYTHPRICT